MSAHFTSVPVDKALEVIRERLDEDQTLSDRTLLAPDDIIQLLSLCLKCTYFLFQGELSTDSWGSHGVASVTDSLQPIYEVLRTVSSSYGKTPATAVEMLRG